MKIFKIAIESGAVVSVYEVSAGCEVLAKNLALCEWINEFKGSNRAANHIWIMEY